jgi:hypothetical protein
MDCLLDALGVPKYQTEQLPWVEELCSSSLRLEPQTCSSPRLALPCGDSTVLVSCGWPHFHGSMRHCCTGDSLWCLLPRGITYFYIILLYSLM